MKKKQLEELLQQALATEEGGIEIYQTAIECARNKELKKEWKKYLDETRTHHEVLLGVFETFGLDPKASTPGKKVVRHKGQALVKAMKMAQKQEEPAAAQLVAAECVVEAETKDHLNWELIGKAAEELKGEQKKSLKEAYEKVEEEEDEHLYHTMGWARELWFKSLGIAAVLPPPEEEKDVKTAIGAARAKHARSKMVGGKQSSA